MINVNFMDSKPLQRLLQAIGKLRKTPSRVMKAIPSKLLTKMLVSVPPTCLTNQIIRAILSFGLNGAHRVSEYTTKTVKNIPKHLKKYVATVGSLEFGHLDDGSCDNSKTLFGIFIYFDSRTETYSLTNARFWAF